MVVVSDSEDEVPQVNVRAMLERRRLRRQRMSRRLLGSPTINQELEDRSASEDSGAESAESADSDSDNENKTSTAPPQPKPTTKTAPPQVAPTPAPPPAPPAVTSTLGPIYVTLPIAAPPLAPPLAAPSPNPVPDAAQPVSITTTLVTITTTKLAETASTSTQAQLLPAFPSQSAPSSSSTQAQLLPALPSQSAPSSSLPSNQLFPNLPAQATASAIPIPAEKQQSDNVAQRSGGLTSATEAGIGVASFVFIAVLISGIVFFYRRKKNSMARPADTPAPDEKVPLPIPDNRGMGPPGVDFKYEAAPPTMGYPGEPVPTMGYPGEPVPTMGYPGEALPTMGYPGEPLPTMGYPGRPDSPQQEALSPAQGGGLQSNNKPGARESFDPYDAYYGGSANPARDSELQYQNAQPPALAPLPQTRYEPPNESRWAPSSYYSNMPEPNNPRR